MVPSYSRRTALQLTGGGFLGVLAGCSALGVPSPSGVQITQAVITNRVERELDVDIHLLDGDETAYWRTIHVDAADPHAGEHGKAGGAVLTDLPESSAEYVAYARLVGIEEDDPVRWNVLAAARDRNASCAEIHLDISQVGPRDGEYPSVTFVTTEDQRYWQCPTTESA